MNDDIIILPYGNFGNKLISLMGAIDLQIRTKKKIKIVFYDVYDDVLFNKDKIFMDEFPPFEFENITYVYEKIKSSTESLILASINAEEHIVDKYLKNKYPKNNSLFDNGNIKQYGMLDNEYPLINKGIIKLGWICGFKNKGAPIVKKWLSDITKFNGYKDFMINIGFDWYDINYEYVVIYLDIGETIKWIQNNTLNTQFILSPEWYDRALKILKKKTNKKLKIFFYFNSTIYAKLLYRYLDVFNKYGGIVETQYITNTVTKLLLMSKIDHFIGPTSFIHTPSYLYSKEHSITITPSHDVIDYKYKCGNYPNKWIFLDDSNFRIVTNRDLSKYDLEIIPNLKMINQDEINKINKITSERIKNILNSRYKRYYAKYDKVLSSTILKNILLYRNITIDDKIHNLNSNISLDEGLLLNSVIKKYNPKKMLEIGFACGISSAFMVLSMDKKSTLTSVDPFQKIQWNKFGLTVIEQIIKENKLSKKNHIWAPYYSHTFFSKKNSKYDLCFIDGDHSYEGTMIDLEGCDNLLNKDGILIIDDVLHKYVKKALNDFMIRNNNKYKQIYNDVKTMNVYIKQV